MSNANKNSNDPLIGYYSTIGRLCGCSGTYAKMVLTNSLGKYSERDTEKVKQIREKAEELKSVLKVQ